MCLLPGTAAMGLLPCRLLDKAIFLLFALVFFVTRVIMYPAIILRWSVGTCRLWACCEWVGGWAAMRSPVVFCPCGCAATHPLRHDATPVPTLPSAHAESTRIDNYRCAVLCCCATACSTLFRSLGVAPAFLAHRVYLSAWAVSNLFLAGLMLLQLLWMHNIIRCAALRYTCMPACLSACTHAPADAARANRRRYANPATWTHARA